MSDLRKENQELRRKLALAQKFNLKGGDLEDFDLAYGSQVQLDDKGEIKAMQSRANGNPLEPDKWVQSATQGAEGNVAKTLLGQGAEGPQGSHRRQVHVNEMEKLSTADLIAYREGRADFEVVSG